ncbi:hypothetical protein FXW78_27920 [Rhodococcus opacus]|nr:hypothetical protein [Rhodococcus opacus]
MEHFAGDHGVMRGPAGEGRAALVARADVTRGASSIMRDLDAHVNRAYTLTGPESLTMSEVAATIADVRGRDVTFVNETVDEAYESRRRWETEQSQYDASVSTDTAMASGASPSTPDCHPYRRDDDARSCPRPHAHP